MNTPSLSQSSICNEWLLRLHKVERMFVLQCSYFVSTIFLKNSAEINFSRVDIESGCWIMVGKWVYNSAIRLCGLLAYILYIYTFYAMHDLYCIINIRALQDS